ncbi:ATP-binding protein [uncultured Mobiluncus sp.]|uniref:ATP-binding protein n=1 Tax=uncultured Mobiluncus sp. TaxID=293425 RepID=UPI0025DCBBAA|nr:ATP-binding protein [uncultured Mobiluncus sp.]
MITATIPRNARVLAEEILSDTPVLTVSGARQVGKSTLVSQLLENRSHRLLNLDNAATLQAAQTDPDGFVRQFPEGIVAIDEIQRVPALLRAIKAALDEDRRPGRFIVTGSSNLMNLKGAEESLAGRAETLRLRGFSRGERKGITEDFAANAWNPHPQLPASDLERIDYLRMITESSFPEIAEATPRRRDRWVQAYVERVLTKDATDLYGIQYPDRLRVLLGKVASQGTSEFVAAHVSRELNIPERSVPGYLNALKNVFLIDVLPAWGTNLTRRVISKPKVFLQDPATAASLVGVDATSLEMQISSSFTGGLLESFVATELLKQREWSAIPFKLFHFRDSTGKEVDLVMESRGREIVGVEVKAAVSLQGKDFSGLRHLQKLAGEKFRCGILLYAGKESLPMGPGLWAMPISALWSV